jgi:lysophospholipase L1-like esterase
VAGGRRGWAALLAAGLAPAGADLLNTARSGARAADVAREQLDLARSHRPHLASVLVGVNDTLRASYDIEQVAESLDTVLRTLHRDGVRTLTACLPDPGRMLGLPLLLARPLARRMRAVNTVVHALSHRYDAIHLHTAELPGLDDRTAWSVDRLHPSERGHRLLARGFHRLLADAGIAHGAPPGARPEQPAPGPAEQLWWIATHGTRWVAARCTDLLPDLLKLAAEEGRHQLAGTVRLLDLRTEHATDAALATLARMGG